MIILVFRAAEYKPTGLSPQTGDLSNVNAGTERFETVILPMQPKLGRIEFCKL